MQHLELVIGDKTFHASSVGEPPVDLGDFWTELPVEGQFIHDDWSHFIVSSLKPVINGNQYASESDIAPYQELGGVYLHVGTNLVSVCYGQGRIRNGLGPLPVVKLGQVKYNLDELATMCAKIQFDGATSFSLRAAREPMPESGVEAEGPIVRVEIGGAQAKARVLEKTVPTLAKSFLESLPLTGLVVNCHSSGPLTRFYNEATGTSHGRTPLECSDADLAKKQPVLYRGYLYYMIDERWAGIRMPLVAPTVMGGTFGGAAGELVPFARLEGEWSSLAAVAGELPKTGAQPAKFTLE